MAIQKKDFPCLWVKGYDAPLHRVRENGICKKMQFEVEAEGQVGPVALNKWYRATFYSKYSSLITTKSSAVFIAADICGSGPPTRTN